MSASAELLVAARIMEVVVTTTSSQTVTTKKPTPSFYRLDALPYVKPTVSKH